jgi:hypothetical protein
MILTQQPIMWRTLLLGKLGISILASLLIGGTCLTQPWRGEYTLTQTTQWFGAGIFFGVLGIIQLLVVYLLLRKKRFSSTE